MSKIFKNAWISDVMKELNFKKLTNIQKATIPLINNNKNLIGVSETGTGKTYCFLFPIYDNINVNEKNIQAIIITPTRELAKQIFVKSKVFKKANKFINNGIIIGGKTNDDFIGIQKNPPHVLIATPSKLIELMTNAKIDLSFLKTIVLDEADMLIDLGFFNVIDSIFNKIKNIDLIQKVAFSATLHQMLSGQLSKYFKNTEIVDLSKKIWVNNKIKHNVIHYNNDKNLVLMSLINQLNPYFCIIFANTKKTVDKLFEMIYQKNKNVLKLHGDLSIRERKNVFKELQLNNTQFLVSTDIASRGIDIDGASHIISWDMPKDDIWYIHRSGRTGRAHYVGESYIFLDDNSENQIIRLKNKGIEWNNLKFHKDNFVSFNYEYKKRIRQKNEYDEEIQKVIATSSKKVKPNYKKKLKIKIHKIKQKSKRNHIENLVNAQRIKKYKIENSKKSKQQ